MTEHNKGPGELPSLPKGMSNTWDMDYHVRAWEAVGERIKARRAHCAAEKIPLPDDLEYVSLQNEQYHHYCRFIEYRAAAFARAQRTGAERMRAKEFGKASRTIHQLRLENSVLRRELFARTGKTLGDLLRDGA